MTEVKSRRALLLVVSAPSGGGKTTLCNRLLAEHACITRSISCTTRAPRGTEIDGKDYHFLSTAEFNRRVSEGLFLEHAVVHGNQYGTLRSNVEEALGAGQDVLMVIDVQGAATVRRAAHDLGGILGRAYVDIFIAPPSLEALRDRLQKRGEDTLEVIERRLVNARGELDRGRDYQHQVINDNLDQAYAELHAIIHAEHVRTPC
jgi:guanylate kinase